MINFLNYILLLIKEAHIYIYVCSHFLNPLVPLFQTRFYLYLYATARDFQCKWTKGPWHQSNIVRALVSWAYLLFSYLKCCARPVKHSIQGQVDAQAIPNNADEKLQSLLFTTIITSSISEWFTLSLLSLQYKKYSFKWCR